MADVYLMALLAASVEDDPCLEVSAQKMIGVVTEEALGLLREFVRQPEAEGLLRLEERLFRQLAQLAGAFAALAVQTVCRTNAPLAARFIAPRSDGKTHWRNQGLRKTPVQFLGGLTAHLETPYWIRTPVKKSGPKRRAGRRGRSGSGCYPALAALGIRFGASPALQSLVARQSVRGASFEETREVLLEQGTSMDVETVHRIALAVAEAALRQRKARVQAAQDGEFVDTGEFTNQRVLIGVDGGRLRCREGGKRGRRRASGRRGFRTPWKEPKLLSAYVIDEQGHPVKTALPVYEATMGDADEAFDLFVTELKLRGIGAARELIVVTDGASWIWNRTKELPSRLGLAEENVIRVADYYHAVEHLQKIAESTDWALEDVKRWVEREKRLLREGHVDRVIAHAKGLKRRKNAKLVAKQINYIQHLAPFMAYDDYKKRGIPRGSGATESAIRRVVNLRFKGPGVFWKIENAESLLHLRAYLKAGRWSELMLRVLHASPDGQALSRDRVDHSVLAAA